LGGPLIYLETQKNGGETPWALIKIGRAGKFGGNFPKKKIWGDKTFLAGKFATPRENDFTLNTPKSC